MIHKLLVAVLLTLAMPVLGPDVKALKKRVTELRNEIHTLGRKGNEVLTPIQKRQMHALCVRMAMAERRLFAATKPIKPTKKLDADKVLKNHFKHSKREVAIAVNKKAAELRRKGFERNRAVAEWTDLRHRGSGWTDALRIAVLDRALHFTPCDNPWCREKHEPIMGSPPNLSHGCRPECRWGRRGTTLAKYVQLGPPGKHRDVHIYDIINGKRFDR
jgi:hypothetical protein